MSGVVRDPATVLGEWYTGEVGGEALFWQLASAAEPGQARKWLALAAVEARTATRLKDALVAAGLGLPDAADSLAWARERATAMGGRPWLAQMEWLEAIAREALLEMQAEAARLPARLAAIGAVVVAHEAALVEFARLERAGDSAASLAPLERFLAVTAPA